MLNIDRIRKTTIFVVIALATVGAVGVMGAMITAATTADAAICRPTVVGGLICPREPLFEVCPPNVSRCVIIGPP